MIVGGGPLLKDFLLRSPKMISISWQSSCLNLLNVKITGMNHQAWQDWNLAWEFFSIKLHKEPTDRQMVIFKDNSMIS